MHAKLAAWGTLLEAGLMPWEDYLEGLHALFLENPEDEFLLELEESTRSFKETCILLRRAAADMDEAAYARLIFAPLEAAYRSGDLRAFFELTRRMYRMMPFMLANEAPFYMLSNAEEILDYGTESQARDEIERALRQVNPDAPPFERPIVPPKPKRRFPWLRRR